MIALLHDTKARQEEGTIMQEKNEFALYFKNFVYRKVLQVQANAQKSKKAPRPTVMFWDEGNLGGRSLLRCRDRAGKAHRQKCHFSCMATLLLKKTKNDKEKMTKALVPVLCNRVWGLETKTFLLLFVFFSKSSFFLISLHPLKPLCSTCSVFHI